MDKWFPFRASGRGGVIPSKVARFAENPWKRRKLEIEAPSRSMVKDGIEPKLCHPGSKLILLRVFERKGRERWFHPGRHRRSRRKRIEFTPRVDGNLCSNDVLSRNDSMELLFLKDVSRLIRVILSRFFVRIDDYII